LQTSYVPKKIAKCKDCKITPSMLAEIRSSPGRRLTYDLGQPDNPKLVGVEEISDTDLVKIMEGLTDHEIDCIISSMESDEDVVVARRVAHCSGNADAVSNDEALIRVVHEAREAITKIGEAAHAVEEVADDVKKCCALTKTAHAAGGTLDPEYSQYLSTLMDPANFAGRVPDVNYTPCVTKKLRANTVYNTGGTQDLLFIPYNHSSCPRIMVYSAVVTASANTAV